MLRRILYISTIAPGVTDEILKQIVAKARMNNRRLDVTGVLALAPGLFAQVLEGTSEAVEATLQRIQADSRHADVRLILDERTLLRHFDRWSMELLVDDESARLTVEARQGGSDASALLERLRRQHAEDPR
ncbi:BLUF domain-containing protein [Roseateles sp. L2-2]|uniref:BLUF domain-containing protein n=1 Tax=Roseateles sp. L2-2 TaxID=3422597 RepID=UPI003D35F21F